MVVNNIANSKSGQRGVVALVAVAALLWVGSAVGQSAVGQSPVTPDKPNQAIDEAGIYQIKRCLFAERRLVIKYDGKIVVLHEGDSIPGGPLRVKSISDNKIVITGGIASRQQGDKVVSLPQQMIIIEKDGNTFNIKRLQDRPDPKDVITPMKQPMTIYVPGKEETLVLPVPTSGPTKH